MRSGVFGTFLVAIAMSFVGGCSALGVGGAAGVGGNEGGTGGVGGAGGMSDEHGWCAPESGDLGETRAPTDIDMAVAADGSAIVVWRAYFGATDLWTNRWTPTEGWGVAERLQTVEGPTARPQVVFDGGGNAIVVWEQSDCVSTHDIWTRRWTPTEGWGTAERIDSQDGRAWYPEVAADASGNVVAVWLQENGVGVRSTWSARWTGAFGWETPERIQSSDSYAWDAGVALDRDGNAIATWRERNPENVYELWLNLWTPTEGWGTPEMSDATGSVGDYDMALDPNGHAFVIWSTGSGGGFDRGIWSARWTGSWEPAEQVVDNLRTSGPKVAIDANGNVVGTWMYWSGSALGGARTWAGRWTPSDGWGDVLLLHDAGEPPQGTDRFTHGWAWDPQVAIDESGNALVVWRESEINADNRQRLNAWACRWTPDEGWAEAEQIDLEERGASSPQVGFDAYDRGVAVWLQDGGLRASHFKRGCSSSGPSGAGGAGGNAGSGGVGGSADLCDGVVCPDTECSADGACDPDTGVCIYTAVAADGSACSEGECLRGGCGRVGALACTEDAIREAISQGGGPHYFACDEPMRILVSEEIFVDNDVTLDGEGELMLDASATGRAVRVDTERSAELRGMEIVGNGFTDVIDSSGSLTLADTTVEGVYSRGTLTIVDSEVRGRGVRNWGGVATITRTQISTDRSDGYGAGIRNSGGTLTLRDSSITGSGFGDFGADAGGVYNSHHFTPQGEFRDGVVLIENSTISGNRGFRAGAIYNNGATLTLRNSTLSNNTAERGPSVFSWTWPGGSVTVTNSTVSGAGVEYECGSEHNGYAFGNRGTLTVTNSTLAANVFGGLDNRGEATIRNSVIDGDCAQFGDDATTISEGYNIVGGTDACGFDNPTDLLDVSSTDLALGPLSDNGGPTMTHALLAGSVAIDAIPGPMCEVTEDQRGEPRPAGGMCDMGAFEVQP